jgi:hypothetical protein
MNTRPKTKPMVDLILGGHMWITSLLVFLSFPLISQKETNNWYFGGYAGLNFSAGMPNVLTNGALITNEGCATISDGLGNLLFYTDGVTVYNQTHVVMANGSGLFGNQTSTQSAIIVKKPGSNTIYYIFTVSGLGFMYSEVDMSLAAGMGSVTTKNTLLHNPTTEKMTAVKHCNGIDVWVVTHDMNSANFRSTLVASTGVNPLPIISTVGSVVSSTLDYNGAVGQLKISPGGKKLGSVMHYVNQNNAVEIYDFDPSNGVVSNLIVLLQSVDFYGCEFSPDGSKFYAAQTPSGNIVQWDLCAGMNAAVIASAFSIVPTTTPVTGSMQLASNGKLYIARGTDYLSVINNPNLAGAACGYVETGQSVSPKVSFLGLPNFISSFFRAPQPFTYSSNCLNVAFTSPSANSSSTLGCSVMNNSVTSRLWNFGDPTSGAFNTSAQPDPSHIYSAAGSYTVQLILNYRCSSDTIKLSINVTSNPQPLTVTGTFTLCKGEARLFSANGASTYSWSNNTSGPSTTLSPSVTTVYTVTGASSSTCQASAIFTVNVSLCKGLEEESSGEVARCFPNPFSAELIIESGDPIHAQLFNQYGLILREESLASGKHIIDARNLQNGVYTLRLLHASGAIIKKIIKAE